MMEEGLGKMVRWERDKDDETGVMEIILRGAHDGWRLKRICREAGWPKTPVERWLDDHPELKDKYFAALQWWAHDLAQEAVEIADQPQIGTITRTKGQEVETTEQDMLGHRRLQVETRLKLASRLNRQIYGETQALSVSAGAGSIIAILASLPPVQGPKEIDVTPEDE